MASIPITANDVDEFDSAITIACQLKSPERLEFSHSATTDSGPVSVPAYFRKSGSLVISFDGGWFPFLDNTTGYNRGDQRWYIPKTSRLVAEVAQRMQRPPRTSQKPGRVFLHSGGAYRRRVDRTEIEIVEWVLPQKSRFLEDRTDLAPTAISGDL